MHPRLVLGIFLALGFLEVDQVLISPLPWPEGWTPDACELLLMEGRSVRPDTGAATAPSCELLALLGVLSPRTVQAPSGAVVATALCEGSALAAVLLADGEGGAREEAASVEDRHASGGREVVLQLETHVDHLTGEEIGLAMEALSVAPEVLDVLWLQGVGKKNRPMGCLRLLCMPEDGDAVGAALFRHTHTLGYRMLFMERQVLPREETSVEVPWGGTLRAKRYGVDGETYVRVESDAVRREASRLGVGAPALLLGRWKRPEKDRNGL